MITTDHVISREFKNNILKIHWYKTGTYEYTKKKNHWYNSLNEKVGEQTNDFLNKEFDKI